MQTCGLAAKGENFQPRNDSSLAADPTDISNVAHCYQQRERAIQELSKLRRSFSERRQQSAAQQELAALAQRTSEYLQTVAKQERVRLECEERILKKYFSIRTDIKELKSLIFDLITSILATNSRFYSNFIELKCFTDAKELLHDNQTFKEEIHRIVLSHSFRLTQIVLYIMHFSRARLTRETEVLELLLQPYREKELREKSLKRLLLPTRKTLHQQQQLGSDLLENTFTKNVVLTSLKQPQPRSEERIRELMTTRAPLNSFCGGGGGGGPTTTTTTTTASNSSQLFLDQTPMRSAVTERHRSCNGNSVSMHVAQQATNGGNIFSVIADCAAQRTSTTSLCKNSSNTTTLFAATSSVGGTSKKRILSNQVQPNSEKFELLAREYNRTLIQYRSRVTRTLGLNLATTQYENILYEDVDSQYQFICQQQELRRFYDPIEKKACLDRLYSQIMRANYLSRQNIQAYAQSHKLYTVRVQQRAKRQQNNNNTHCWQSGYQQNLSSVQFNSNGNYAKLPMRLRAQPTESQNLLSCHAPSSKPGTATQYSFDREIQCGLQLRDKIRSEIHFKLSQMKKIVTPLKQNSTTQQSRVMIRDKKFLSTEKNQRNNTQCLKGSGTTRLRTDDTGSSTEDSPIKKEKRFLSHHINGSANETSRPSSQSYLFRVEFYYQPPAGGGGGKTAVKQTQYDNSELFNNYSSCCNVADVENDQNQQNSSKFQQPYPETSIYNFSNALENYPLTVACNTNLSPASQPKNQ